MTDLKPCPICGGKAELIMEILGDELDMPYDDCFLYYVYCPMCRNTSDLYEEKEDAIGDWNGEEDG